MTNDKMPMPVPDERMGPENYWTVGTTAMTQEEAEQAADLISSRFAQVHADVVEPRYWLSLILDRSTVVVLRESVARFVANGGDAGDLLEDFDEWLAIAEPVSIDEES